MAVLRENINEFEIFETVGVGTAGTVYRAKDTRSGNEVALKILLPAASENSLISARFEREMLILEKLIHPNIVRYFGGGKTGKQLFFAMELIGGGSLKELMTHGGPLSWQEAASCGIQLCSALQHAHNHGVIHRDLKPANLYFSLDGTLKLGDFGIARDLFEEDITEAGLTVGTYAYMSPEQIRGEESISGKTDLYALGCVLFEMLTSRRPFEGNNFQEFFAQHLNESPPRIHEIIPDIPHELDTIIAQLLEKDPEKRPFNAREVQGKLLNLATEPPIKQNAPRLNDKDVGAANVRDAGQSALAHRITLFKEGIIRHDVSWTSLAILFASLLILILLAAWLTN